MILQLQPNILLLQKETLLHALAESNFQTTEVTTQYGQYLVAIGKTEIDIRLLGHLDGIADIHVVNDTYKLVSKQWKVNPTQIDLGDGVFIGSDSLAIMAGPCSIESEEQVEETVLHLVSNGVRIMRGGVFKPRSSPYSFRGMGIDGLKLFANVCRKAGIKIITEVMQVSQIAEMIDYVDIFQVGARNTQNFNLLDELGAINKPVLLKRGISGSVDELLQSAEYIFSGGNERIILCERGIRTYETASRNTLDLNAIPILKDKSHLPVIVDPSHGIGIRAYVEPMALAAIMAGADGIIYETHQTPQRAASDGAQTLNFDESAQMIGRVRATYNLRKSFTDV